MNRRGFLRAATATSLFAAFPASVALPIALDPFATVLDPSTTIYSKWVSESGFMYWQCSLAYLQDRAPEYLRMGYEVAYLGVEPMPTSMTLMRR